MKVGRWLRVSVGVGLLSTIGLAEPASAPRPAMTPVPAGLAGSASCRDCHAPFYEKWADSRHGRSVQPLSASLAATLRPPAGTHRIRGKEYRVELDGSRAFVVEQASGDAKKYPVDYAIGGKNAYYFLTTLDRGRLQVLPLAFDVRRNEWLDTTASAARGVAHFEEEVLDWRNPQLTFNSSCHGCHVSQFASNYDPRTDSYRSSWAEPGISCETCHGPGAEHVALFRNAPPDRKFDDLRIISTKSFTAEQTNALCATCHAKGIALTASFVPGERFFDHFDLVGLEHVDYYPDGRDLGENYTYTSWRMSPCVKSGRLSCLHCHTSSGRYLFEEEPNRACLPCHAGHVENPTAHTHHPAGSAARHCVACHMPTTEFARMRRSDHSMRPPMPAATIAFGSPNACNLCHADRDAAWADAIVRTWHDYQAATLRAGALIDAARRRDWSRLDDMLAYLADSRREEAFASALIRLLRGCPDERKWPAILDALKDESPWIRAAAAEALEGYVREPGAAALMRAAADEYRLVRVRAAGSLAGLPVENLAEGSRRDLERATKELLAIVEARPDDASSHFNLGNYHAARKEHERAIACYERALALQPDLAAALVNASLAHHALGKQDQAEAALRRAVQLDPDNAPAHLNLGLLLAERNKPAEAERALRAAFAAAPQSSAAAYNLAALLLEKDAAEAVDWAGKAVQIDPGDARIVYLLAFCQQRAGRLEPAMQTLRGLLADHPDHAEAYALLGELLEQAGRREEARDLYRQAAARPDLPSALRQEFAHGAARLATP